MRETLLTAGMGPNHAAVRGHERFLAEADDADFPVDPVVKDVPARFH